MLLGILLSFLLLETGFCSENGNPCHDPGIFPNPEDSSSFLICSEVDNSAKLTKIVKCPTNYTFSEIERTCVKEHTSPHPRTSRAISSDICKSVGPVCSSCDLLVVCVDIDNKITPLLNVSCSQTSPENICDAKTHSCKPPDATSTCKPSSATSTFRCLQPGFFPDPSDCRKYHICDDRLIHYEDWCERKYDAVNASCQDDKTCTNAASSTPCSPSNFLSQTVSDYPSFYTVCIPTVITSPGGATKVIYQTAVLQCPSSKEFNPITYSCEMVCKTRPDRMADLEDCHYYYECAKPADSGASAPAPVRKACAANLAFDSVKKMCAPESRVPSCAIPRIITTREVNETQMPAPNTTLPTVFSTSIASTPATTTLKVQTSTARPESNPVAPKPMSPPSRCIEGALSVDRSNCHFYFRCSGGQLWRRTCPFFMNFNPSIGRCIFSLSFFC